MIERIMDCDIHYIQYGNKSGRNLVLLHGWGQNIEMMKPVGDMLCDDNYITIIDLPGFGKSSEPLVPFTLYDYYLVIDKLLSKLKINNPIMIGHSFGGRISIIYSALNKTDKLILFSSPFIKRITKDSLKVKILKAIKKIPGLNKLENIAKKFIGSRDYRNASIMMRKILVNTVNEDLTDYVKKIKASTIVITGELDSEVSLEETNMYEKYIDDVGIIVYPNCTHYAYIEDINRTINIIKSFL